MKEANQTLLDCAARAARSRTSKPLRSAIVVMLLLTAASTAVAQTTNSISTLFAFARGPDTLLPNALVQALRTSSPVLSVRRAALRAAESRAQATGFLPPFSLSGEVEEVSHSHGLPRPGSTRLELTRDFQSRDLRGAQRAIAATDVERARIALQASERALIIEAEYLLLRTAGFRMIVNRFSQEDSLLISAEEALRTRFAVGDAKYVDVLRLRSERLRIQTERAAALSDAQISRSELVSLASGATPLAEQVLLVDSAVARLLTGVTEGDSTTVLLSAWPALPPPPDVDSVATASTRVRLAEADVARAQASRRLALASQRPLFSASLGAQRFSDDAGGFTIGPVLGFSVSLPFTAGRAASAATSAAEQGVEAARVRQSATISTVRTALSAALTRYVALRERLSLYDAALLRGARDERETALASYRSADLSLIELLDFERALARAEVTQIRGYIEAARALADLLSGSVSTRTDLPEALDISTTWTESER